MYNILHLCACVVSLLSAIKLCITEPN